MENQTVVFLLFISCFLNLFHPSVSSVASGKEEHNVYIVLVKDRDDADLGQQRHTESWHDSLLSAVIPDHSSRLVYSYKNVVNGFAARLSESEIEALKKQDWFLEAFPSRKYKLLTTHSQTFLGLRDPKVKPNGVWSTTNMGEGIIIGVLDTGISPDHPSFRDEGLAPPPAKWKGHCDFNASVCNNKLIGARRILKASGEEGHLPPVDTIGHGTHVASTAAGAFVKNAGAFGSAVGIASGAAPRAHLAVYQVCVVKPDGCQGADLLKAIETAVDDGVDVLSLSIGLADPKSRDTFYDHAIAIGAFYAISRGVFVSCAGGNEGPGFRSLYNDIPWILTVGASSTDRRMSSIVKLGNGVELYGQAFMQPNVWKSNMVPLVTADTLIPPLDKQRVHGKIILCEMDNEPASIEKEVRSAGVIGVIFKSPRLMGQDLMMNPLAIPTAFISYDDTVKIEAYMNSTQNATATFIFKGTVMKSPNSPSIAFFSSRGPSRLVPKILKPDIVGPGIDILAAFPPNLQTADTHFESEQFVFMSGTSMSTPHLSGIAALIKKAHPKWSPAAIKSAIMTTTYTTNGDGKPITDERGLPANFYALGAGHVDPNKAVDPGLIYDLKPKEYIPFLCGLGMTDAQVQNMISSLLPVKCSQVKKISQEQLNYPSMVATLKFNTTVMIKRTVRNVGNSSSTYNAKIDSPRGVFARVMPPTLSFNKKNERKSFYVAFTWIGGKPAYSEGELKWISMKHVVRSPIVINKAHPDGSVALPPYFPSE